MSGFLPLKPSFEEFSSLAGEGNLIPVFTQISADFETPLSAYCRLRNGEHSFLLESAERTDVIGRYSFIGSDPRFVMQMRGKEVVVSSVEGRRQYMTERDPLAELEELMSRYKPVDASRFGLPMFDGGAVGYLAFDGVRYFEPTVGEPPPDVLGFPDALFLVTATVVVFDHLLRRITVVDNVCVDDFPDLRTAYESARENIALVLAKLEQPLHLKAFNALQDDGEGGELVSNTSREEFHAMVEKAKEHIHAGDIFQVVPSQRFEVPFSGDPVDLYRALRHVNPSPYMFCIELPQGFSIVGSSPEVHVRCENGAIDIRPIAGTRWRGKTVEEDEALARELLEDPKERAEHLMLVDLARNDVGRVAELESVEVTDFMVIERYSHVMHIVSHVRGRLRPGSSAYDVVRATFPAGTVSGAPKVRAVQILYEMEKHKRNVYAGAIGYFGFEGNHDSCIALRTCVISQGVAYVQAGAGVVADSDPEYEYRETCNKAKGMLRAIELAGRMQSSSAST